MSRYGRRDAPWPGRGARGAHHRGQRVERRAQTGRESLGARRRHEHAGRSTDEDGVAEGGAQPGERVAGRRLRQTEAGRGAGDVPFGEERVEREEQVEIDARELAMNAVHVHHAHLRLYSWPARPH